MKNLHVDHLLNRLYFLLAGFAFVTFESDEVVDKVCEIHFHEINSKMVRTTKSILTRVKKVYCNIVYSIEYK